MRSYDQCPCTSISFTRKRNCAIAKSLAITACMPSWPEMPTPTCAIWIIDTSFAPSPIASVIASRLSLTRLTTCAFCSGVARHATTTCSSSDVVVDVEEEGESLNLCCAVLCCAVLCCAVLCCVVLCGKNRKQALAAPLFALQGGENGV